MNFMKKKEAEDCRDYQREPENMRRRGRRTLWTRGRKPGIYFLCFLSCAPLSVHECLKVNKDVSNEI